MLSPTILFWYRQSRNKRNGQAHSLQATAGRSGELIGVVCAILHPLGSKAALFPLTGEPMGRGAKLSAALLGCEANMVSTIVPSRATAKFSSALMYGAAAMVSSNVPNRATAICVSVAAPIRL